MPTRKELLGAYLGQIGQGIAQWGQASAQAKQAALEEKRKQEQLDLQKKIYDLSVKEAKRAEQEAERELKARENLAKQFDKQYGGEARQGLAQMAQTQARLGPTRENAALIERGMDPQRALSGGMPALQAQSPAVPSAPQAGPQQPRNFAESREYYKNLMGLAIRANMPNLVVQLAPRAFGMTEQQRAEYDKMQVEIESGKLDNKEKQNLLNQYDKETRAIGTLSQYYNEQAFEASQRGDAVTRERYAEASQLLQAGQTETAIKMANPGLAPNMVQAVLIRNRGNPEATARQLRRLDENPSVETLAMIENDPNQPKAARDLARKTRETIANHELATKGKHANVFFGPNGEVMFQGDPGMASEMIDRMDMRTINKAIVEPSIKNIMELPKSIRFLDRALQSAIDNPQAYTLTGGLGAIVDGLLTQVMAITDAGADQLRAEIQNTRTSLAEGRVDTNFYRNLTAYAMLIGAQEGDKRVSDQDFKVMHKSAGASDLAGPQGFARGILNARQTLVEKYGESAHWIKTMGPEALRQEGAMPTMPPPPSLNVKTIPQQQGQPERRPVPTHELEAITGKKQSSTKELIDRLLGK